MREKIMHTTPKPYPYKSFLQYPPLSLSLFFKSLVRYLVVRYGNSENSEDNIE
jgi:hypothetical protein